MSVLDFDKVDGVAIMKDGSTLAMLISDHLDWTNEYDHLIKLQKKINAYISFIENNQYEKIYPAHKFASFQIEIHFQYDPTQSCQKFIETVNNQLCEIHTVVNYIIG
jgi:hypothetical protein